MLVSEFSTWYNSPKASKRKVVQHMQGVGSHNKNDCIIQALTNALMLPYEECKALAVHHGWHEKQGIYSSYSFDLLTQLGFRACIYNRKTNAARELRRIKPSGSFDFTDKGCTIGTWLKTPEAQTGVHIVVIPGHVFCVRNGVVFDARANPSGSRIAVVYKLNQD
jgi:hypothetical protein